MRFNVLAVDVAVLVFVPLFWRGWQCGTDLGLVFAWAGCLVSAERQCQRGSGRKRGVQGMPKVQTSDLQPCKMHPCAKAMPQRCTICSGLVHGSGHHGVSPCCAQHHPTRPQVTSFQTPTPQLSAWAALQTSHWKPLSIFLTNALCCVVQRAPNKAQRTQSAT